MSGSPVDKEIEFEDAVRDVARLASTDGVCGGQESAETHAAIARVLELNVQAIRREAAPADEPNPVYENALTRATTALNILATGAAISGKDEAGFRAFLGKVLATWIMGKPEAEIVAAAQPLFSSVAREWAEQGIEWNKALSIDEVGRERGPERAEAMNVDLPLHRHDRDIEVPWARARIDALLAAGARSILDVGGVDGFVMDAYPQAYVLDVRPLPAGARNGFIRSDISDVDEADETARMFRPGFDVVVCISAIEHVGLGFYGDPPDSGEDGPDLAFKSLVRLTKPGGHILLTVPIDLTRQDGPDAARYWTITKDRAGAWMDSPDVVRVETLLVEAGSWTGYPDPAGGLRYVLLATLKKRANG